MTSMTMFVLESGNDLVHIEAVSTGRQLITKSIVCRGPLETN
jgi:hypothetical protein